MSVRASLFLLCAVGCAPPAIVDPALHCPARDEIDCATDVGGFVPLELTGTTTGAEDTYSGSRCGIGGGIAVEDAGFRWTAPRTGFYRFTTEGSSFNTILSVRRGSCGGMEIVCNDDASPGSGYSTATLLLQDCATVTLVVDGFDAEGIGDFELAIAQSEQSCDDGLDDDQDGMIDCGDSDCFGARCDVLNDEWPAESAELELGVLSIVNRVRAEGATCGDIVMPPVPPVERDLLLERAARRHSFDMAENGYLSHDSLDGRTLNDRVTEAGFTGSSTLGENIAAGQATADDVMAGWMSSPDHCRNIMNAQFHLLGVGFASDPANGPYWTQDFAGPI